MVTVASWSSWEMGEEGEDGWLPVRNAQVGKGCGSEGLRVA